MASIGQRFAGYLIDIIPIMILGFVVGYSIDDMRTGGRALPIQLIGAGYLLLRDVGGASVGKLLLGLRVVGADGGPTGMGNRILRNLPQALGPAMSAVAFSSTGFMPVLGAAIGVIDAVFLVAEGRRLGDRIARTAVAART